MVRGPRSGHDAKKSKKGRRVARKRQVDEIEAEIGITDLPDDFRVMRQAMEEISRKAKEAERKHSKDNINETLRQLAGQLRKIEGQTPNATSPEYLPAKLQLLNEKHVNAVADCVTNFLSSLLRSGAWFVYRTHRYRHMLSVCQRAYRRWSAHVRGKLDWLLYIWCCHEAADQSQARQRRGRRQLRGQKAEGISSLSQFSSEYFSRWIPKDLKLAVLRELYQEKRRAWLEEFREWRRGAEAERAAVNRRRALLIRMHKSENRLRQMAGMVPAMLCRSNSLADGHVLTRCGPPPPFPWFEDILCNLTLQDFVNRAYVKERELSAAKLGQTRRPTITSPSAPLSHSASFSAASPRSAEHRGSGATAAAPPQAQQRGQRPAKQACLLHIMQQKHPDSHTVLIKVFSKEFSHPNIAGLRVGVRGLPGGGADAKPPRPKGREARVNFESSDLGPMSPRSQPAPNSPTAAASPRRARVSLDEAAARAILLGSGDLSTVRSLADAQATEKLAQRRISEGLRDGGLVGARAVLEQVRRESGLQLDPVTLGPRSPSAGASPKRWKGAVNKLSPLLAVQTVYYFTGMCSFRDCHCKMFKLVGNTPQRSRSGEVVCSGCGHWCRYHADSTGRSLTESDARCLWLAAARFDPPTTAAPGRVLSPAGRSQCSVASPRGASRKCQAPPSSLLPLQAVVAALADPTAAARGAAEAAPRPLATVDTGSFVLSPLYRKYVERPLRAATAAGGGSPKGPGSPAQW
eukprot:TRINITY_DN17331_c0_g1_i4.p1 TRINITY_DN17331_c0_g1~~TRINITY_DN17331_c0_g1_i4.p1  ORF type:complete len:781 (+),score=217.07 TRINITY_DN17331_c0_g1_i4:103-2343(+)